MPSVAVLIPVLARPERADPVARSVRYAQTVDTTIVFLCTPGDTAEIAACRSTGEDVVVTDWQGGRGDYARKINLGATIVLDRGFDFVFTGADDLHFPFAWDKAVINATRGRERIVVGTVDHCNPRTRRARHSTHSLVSAAYIEDEGTVDEQGVVYHAGYWHNFVDDEMVATAKSRGLYQPSTAVVEHLHPDRRRAPDDATYRLGREHFDDDRRLFKQREPLWFVGGRGERTAARRRRRHA